MITKTNREDEPVCFGRYTAKDDTCKQCLNWHCKELKIKEDDKRIMRINKKTRGINRQKDTFKNLYTLIYVL